MKTKNIILFGVLGVVGLILILGVMASSPGNEPYLDDSSPVMYFHSDSCHFCAQQKPILRELASEGYRVKLMDVGRNPALWQEYGITGTPAFIAENGERLSGLTQKQALRTFLASNGAKIA
ncbi:thioredoxin family protein [Candidatus Micrarchaeota archaeon]|nr:thioredoxin family protein [Candidatus Micrarchaeota archaeon]